MAWSAPTDPVDFNEAIAWFRKRVSMSKADHRLLAAQARRKAFTVANVAKLDLVNQVWKAIDDAVSKGTSLEDFKKAIGDDLRAAWKGSVGDPPWRLETIFRTNVQLAYGAGRFKQATHPDVVGDRPVWMFDAILDGRETEICQACDETKRPADDPWWRDHLPPLHHNCRSSFIALTDDQARLAGGVTAQPTTKKAGDGFGLEPGADEWKPDAAKYPAPLWTTFVAKQAAAPPPPPPARLEAGLHIKNVDSQVSRKERDELLRSVTDPALLEFLERFPLQKLILRKEVELDGDLVNGWYSYVSGELAVTVDRQSFTFGSKLKPGTSWSISQTASTKEQAAKRTLVHELGHHVHLTSPSTKTDTVVRQAFAKATKKPVTEYSKTNHKEYFAECFAAYYTDRSMLRTHDPVGFKMVEDVLRERGMLP